MLQSKAQNLARRGWLGMRSTNKAVKGSLCQTSAENGHSRKGPSKGWANNSPFVEFARQNRMVDCKHSMPPHGYCPRLATDWCHYHKLGKLAGLCHGWVVPHLPPQASHEPGCRSPSSSHGLQFRPDGPIFHMLWPRFSPTGCGRSSGVTRNAIWLRTRNPLYLPPVPLLGKSSRCSTSASALASGLRWSSSSAPTGPPFRNFAGDFLRLSAGLFEGAMAFHCSRAGFLGDRMAVRLDAGCRRPSTSSPRWHGRPSAPTSSVFWILSANSWLQTPFGGTSPMGHFPGAENYFACDQ